MDFTFDSIKTTLKNRLSLLSNWSSVLYYGVYERIVDAVSYPIARLAYLAEIYYRESTWANALKLKNLSALAKFIGYVPHRKVAAGGSILLTMDSTGFYNDYTYSSLDVIIPQWTEFTDTGGTTIVTATSQTVYQTGTFTEKLLFNNGSSVEEGTNLVSLPITYAGSFLKGDTIYISGTQNYDGYYEIYNITSTKLYIEATFFAETITNTMFFVKGLFLVPVKEGTVKTFTYTAQGSLNEIITVNTDSMDNEEFQVDIVDNLDNVLYQVNICGKNGVDTKLYYITDLVNYYCEVTSSVDFLSVQIKFGDGVYGRKLTAGTLVRIKYLQTKGDLGNILSRGIIVKNKTALYDGDGNAVTFYITNNEEISNGNSIEEVEHIRNYGNKIFVSGYRCGSNNDWLTILTSNQNISKAKVSNMDEIGSTDAVDANKVFITAISTDGSALTTIQKNSIVIDVKANSQKSTTEIISWRDPVIMFILAKINATIENQPFTVVRALINSALTAKYGILNADFQGNIYESNYIRIIDSVQYMKYHVTEFYYLEKNLERLTTNYLIKGFKEDTIVLEDQIKIQPDTLELWLYRKIGGVWNDEPVLIAKDISGTWVGQQGDLGIGLTYTINNKMINFTNGTISFAVQEIIDNPTDYGVRDPQTVDDLGYIISVAYKTQDGNGEQLTDIRLAEDRYITDIDTNYVLTDFNYV